MLRKYFAAAAAFVGVAFAADAQAQSTPSPSASARCTYEFYYRDAAKTKPAGYWSDCRGVNALFGAKTVHVTTKTAKRPRAV